MPAAPSAEPFTSLSVRVLVGDSFGQAARCENLQHHSAACLLPYFFVCSQRKKCESKQKNRAVGQ